jgi:hypothetical protein
LRSSLTTRPEAEVLGRSAPLARCARARRRIADAPERAFALEMPRTSPLRRHAAVQYKGRTARALTAANAATAAVQSGRGPRSRTAKPMTRACRGVAKILNGRLPAASAPSRREKIMVCSAVPTIATAPRSGWSCPGLGPRVSPTRASYRVRGGRIASDTVQIMAHGSPASLSIAWAAASSDAASRDFPAIHQSAPGNRHAPCNDGCEPNVWALLIRGASEPFGELFIRAGQRQRSNGNC